jgi:two-component system, NarL family, sensor histidine kinase UhpB
MRRCLNVIVAVLCTCWLSLLAQVVNAQPASGQPAQVKSTSSEFKVYTQAQLSWAASATPPSDYTQSTTLPADWQQADPHYSGAAWYRIRLERPDTELPAVYIERVCTNAEVWVNGTLVGSGGAMQPPLARNCYYPQMFNVARSLLREGENVLDIRLAAYSRAETAAQQRQAGLSVVRIGAEPALRDLYDDRYFRKITVAQIISVTLLLFGLLSLAIFAVRRQERQYLYFALAQFGWALATARMYVREIELSGFHTEILISSLVPATGSLFALFVLHYVGKPLRWAAGMVFFYALAWPVILLIAGPNHLFRLASIGFGLAALNVVGCFAYATHYAWKNNRTEFYVMAGVLFFVSIMVCIEIAIQFGLLPQPKVHFIHFVVPFVFFAIFVRMAQQFAQALNRSERMTHELELRVAEKAKEIERNYAEISALRTVEVVQQERQRIAADLHDDLGAKLLTIAQTPTGPAHEPTGRTATLAREALDDMRLSVRGLTAQPSPAVEVLADWRAEVMQRLDQAGIDAQWHCNEPPQGLVLRSRTQMQLTRVLRESVSNVIRHAQAKRCHIRIEVQADTLSLCVEDDGRGIPAQDVGRRGHGLINMERRARNLGGHHEIGRSALGGARIWVLVPLDDAQSMPAPLH